MHDLMHALEASYGSGLLLHEAMHGLVSFVFVVLIWLKTKSLKYSIVPLIVTYAIDLDHLVDYFLYFGPTFSALEFVNLRYFINTSRAVVPLHGWEWAFFLLALSWQEKTFKSFKFVIAVGIFSHLILDSYNIGSVLFYSFTFRALNEFIIL